MEGKSSLRTVLKHLIKWGPVIGWIILLIFSSELIKFHQVFTLFVILTPFVSVFVLTYYLVLWLLRRTTLNKAILGTIILIQVINYSDHWFSIGSSVNKDVTKIRVLTWNVQRLGSLSESANEKENLALLKSIILESGCDVAVIQEVSVRQKRMIAQALGVVSENVLWTSYFKGAKGGIAIFIIDNNNWKLINKQVTDLPPSWKSGYAELKHTNGQTVNLLGIHISPPKVTYEELKYSSKKILRGKTEKIKSLLRKFVKQSHIQTRQLTQINNLLLTFKDPTIIAGDFNTTSQLPIHKSMRATMKDCWLEGGNGLGATRHWANIIPFRIDYIYVSDKFKVIKTHVKPAHFSDHNCLYSEIQFEEN